MAKANSNLNVIDITDYLKANSLLKQDEVKDLIAKQRAALKTLDVAVMNLQLVKHKLNDIQSWKNASVKLENNLVNISDWLEERIAEAKSDDIKAAHQRSLKECEQLISRNERAKKNISDDIAAGRYKEGKEGFDPVKVFGFMTTSALGMGGLEKIFHSDKPEDITHAAGAGALFGALLAFRYQARDLCLHMREAIANSPPHIKSLKKKAYISTFNAAVVVSLAIEEAKGLKTNYPERRSIIQSRMVIARPR